MPWLASRTAAALLAIAAIAWARPADAEERKRFFYELGVRGTGGLYEVNGRLRFLDEEVLRGRVLVAAEVQVGVGTVSLTDIDPEPVYEVRGRVAIRELPIEETTLELSAAAIRLVQVEYAFERFNAAAGVVAPLRSWVRLGGGYNVEIARVTGPEVPDLNGGDGAESCAGCVTSSLTQAAMVDLTDPLPPLRGVRMRLDLVEAGGPLGGDFPFLRVTPEVVGYLPVHARVTAAGRLRVGMLLGDAPLYQRFFAGGADSIRSFGYGRLAPYARAANGAVVPVGGEGLALLTAEARVTLPEIPGLEIPLTAVVFVDAARVSVAFGELFLGPPAVAAGGGMRADTPLGRLRVDIGFSVVRPALPTIGPDVTPPDLPPWTVHLAIGEAF